jgi:4-diphosphocytidyl-2-C-methyl-D-erythritol kinase
VRRAPAAAKINLALVVGPPGDDGRHEVTTVLQRVDLADRVSIAPAPALTVTGFADDTLVRKALVSLAAAAGVEPRWGARIQKRIPVASGLGGGSSDAATALRLANDTLGQPLATDQLLPIAASLGADVPFFLAPGPQLGEGDGSALTPLELPQDFWVLLLMPNDRKKESTASVYSAFDRRDGWNGYEKRRDSLHEGLAQVRRPSDLAALPPNDLAVSPIAADLRGLGAFRADVSGAGPCVYGLFEERDQALRARRAVRGRGRTWLVVPTWYF